MDNVEQSIKRAQKVLRTTSNFEKYISIKIKPINGGCCCFHCWPETWNAINKEILRYGYLEDEGDVAIGNGDDKIVLECHESGPEIIIPIGIAGATLLVNIYNLIITIIKFRQQEKTDAKFKILKRVIKNKKVIEENVMEIDFPISKENIVLLNKQLNDILTRDKN